MSIVNSAPHCLTENALKRKSTKWIWLRFYTEDKSGVSIIDSISHCHTENASKLCSKMSKTKKCGYDCIQRTSIIVSIPHCHSTAFLVWQFGILMMISCILPHRPLYRNVATFLGFCSFSKHFQYDNVEYYP